MANTIQHVCEPDRLYLAWQAPDAAGDRFRWAVAVVTPSPGGCRLHYFSPDEFKAVNGGREFSEAVRLGYHGYPAFNARRSEHGEGVLEAFMRRLPPRSRPDYSAYRAQFRIAPSTALSDFAMLGVTEAKLPNDGFSLVDPLNSDSTNCDLLLEVAGFRHYVNKLDCPLETGQQLEITPEPENAYDSGAVAVRANGETIGYVNRLQAPTFLRWLEKRTVTAEIERLNGSPLKPRAFMFVTVRSTG